MEVGGVKPVYVGAFDGIEVPNAQESFFNTGFRS